MRFNKLANKKILLDIPTSSLLSSLRNRRETYGLSVSQLAEKLCVNRSTIDRYERRDYPPTLLTLINMSEFFSYDLSASLNYKFFHRQIRADELKARIKSMGLTSNELASLTGYSKAAINVAIRLSDDTSIFCLNAVLNALCNYQRR